MSAKQSGISGATVFAAVPYVEVGAPFEMGPWRLWPNTMDHWLRETGRDHTPFMRMYRGRYFGRSQQPGAVEAKGSVLTRVGGKSPTREEFDHAIHALSTLAWLDEEPSADPWLFEIWHLTGDQRDFFSRVSKFHHNITTPEIERVYATPYTFPIRLRPSIPGELVSFIAAELAKPAKDSLLRSLGQFHAARFDTPYFSSHGNDLEAIWSGFEAWFLPQKTAEKDTSMAAAIWRELGGVPGIDTRLEAAIQTFVQRLYLARNGHTHQAQEPSPEDSMALDRSLLFLGLDLASAILKIRAFKSNDWFVSRRASALFESFFRMPRSREFVAMLGKIKNAETWYAALRAGTQSSFAFSDLAAALGDVLSFESRDGFRGDADVRGAASTMGRVLSCWIGDLSGVQLGAIATLPTQARQALDRLKNEGKRGADLVEGLNHERVEALLACQDEWRAGGTLDPNDTQQLCGQVSLRQWIQGVVRMHELFLGYELLHG